jgi:hypothetical protein
MDQEHDLVMTHGHSSWIPAPCPAGLPGLAGSRPESVEPAGRADQRVRQGKSL